MRLAWFKALDLEQHAVAKNCISRVANLFSDVGDSGTGFRAIKTEFAKLGRGSVVVTNFVQALGGQANESNQASPPNRSLV